MLREIKVILDGDEGNGSIADLPNIEKKCFNNYLRERIGVFLFVKC